MKATIIIYQVNKAGSVKLVSCVGPFPNNPTAALSAGKITNMAQTSDDDGNVCITIALEH